MIMELVKCQCTFLAADKKENMSGKFECLFPKTCEAGAVFMTTGGG